MKIDFRSQVTTAQFRSPDGTEVLERRCEVRFDPLLGTSSRIAEGVKLQTAEPLEVQSFRQPDSSCPFCPERVENVTPKIKTEICPEGRIRVGETLLFPNLVPYSKYAAVAVFSNRHWLELTEFTPRLITDNLTATIQYVRAVFAVEKDCRACAYNINYLYPSGGSLPHPHAQVFLDPQATTVMRLQRQAATKYFTEHGSCYWSDLARAEEQRRERFVHSDGRIAWFTPFAPVGFNEVHAVVLDRETLLDLDENDVGLLADGISRVLGWYSSKQYNSFNLVLYSGALGGAPDYRVNLALITRTAMVRFYRSDSMYLERLHWKAAVDRTPETIAKELRSEGWSTNVCQR